ncbi:MAG: sel1 repeat family protein [Hydrogenophaga sp.]|uniref:tetratricopeptide repeat protein n=1 Tax=Hydrogenophaga sp. TaxID=1904254 RepID=UPI0026139737|nr:tetratricopeptide repeat protein [Hydrogenophaga sp.]MCW5672475.1 sel1 repeat family protein [Hydrogenophaga sp.]
MKRCGSRACLATHNDNIQEDAQAMKLGHWKAQLNLAQMYLEGRGVEFNPDEALRLTEELMRQGVPAAWHRMGSLYMMGAGPLRQDATVAYAFWQRAAEMGSMESQAFLGEKLSANHDEPPNFWGNWPIGKKMMECSLAQGFGRASYDLGVMLDVKAQTPEDYRNALAIFQQGVRLGCQECARYLGSAFRLGSPMIGRAKDPSRGERYWHISERLRMDHYLKLPNLDRVLPLPPAPLPHWNSDPDTLIDAAKGVRGPAHQLRDEFHAPPPARPPRSSA